jgi:dolichol-phosphate mannosyltransferase
VITLDSDLQHPPALIPALLEQYALGHDVVQAVRRSTADASWFKAQTSRAFYSIFNLLSDTPIRPGAADFVLLSARACEALASLTERRRFLRGMVSWIGFRSTGVIYDATPRHAGRSKYTPLRMLRLALDAVFSFSSAPIRVATRLGIAVALLGLAYLLYVLVHALLGGVVQGWPSLISLVLILGGLQICFIGLIGEYIARIFDESKRRPLYLLKQRPVAPPFAASTPPAGSAAP